MSRAVIYEAFGGPEVLQVREVAEPHAGPGEVRVRVTAAGLNPMDWLIPSRPEAAAQFGLTLPSGFGYDFAGVVDEVGGGATGFAVGDRVYGGALARAVADFVVLKASAEGAEGLFHTPDGVSDVVAGTLPVAGATAAAALAAIGLRSGDTVLIGGAVRPDAALGLRVRLRRRGRRGGRGRHRFRRGRPRLRRRAGESRRRLRGHQGVGRGG